MNSQAFYCSEISSVFVHPIGEKPPVGEQGQRDIEEELQMVESVRKHVARILRTLKLDDFQRTVKHSESGPITLEKLLTNITNHIPHHIKFIKDKRQAMA